MVTFSFRFQHLWILSVHVVSPDPLFSGRLPQGGRATCLSGPLSLAALEGTRAQRSPLRFHGVLQLNGSKTFCAGH